MTHESDDLQQTASTVDNHMKKLVKNLKDNKILKDGGRVLGSTDGCAKQCKCSTVIRFMSHLSSKEKVVIDRAIGCPGHGKCEVDAINGVDKNTIHREAMKTSNNSNLDRAGKSDTSQLQTFTVNNARGERKHSAALNCKHVLESKGAEGVKSEGKSAKRERERGINRRHWHVRDLTEELSNVKCETIKRFSDDSCKFSDICHHCACPELGPRMAALRRFPCNCTACVS